MIFFSFLYFILQICIETWKRISLSIVKGFSCTFHFFPQWLWLELDCIFLIFVYVGFSFWFCLLGFGQGLTMCTG